MSQYSIPATVTVTIPDATASRSKMQKKGWKCWAKWLTSVATPANDGYAYEGEFTQVGAQVECEPGDVLLHVDQSDCAGIAVVGVNALGKGYFKWIETASSDGRKWCGPLARHAREWLAMSSRERLAALAAMALDAERKEPLGENAIAWYTWLAGRETVELLTYEDLSHLSAVMFRIAARLDRVEQATARTRSEGREADIQDSDDLSAWDSAEFDRAAKLGIDLQAIIDRARQTVDARLVDWR